MHSFVLECRHSGWLGSGMEGLLRDTAAENCIIIATSQLGSPSRQLDCSSARGPLESPSKREEQRGFSAPRVWGQAAWVQRLALPLKSWVISGRVLNLPHTSFFSWVKQVHPRANSQAWLVLHFSPF